VQELIDALNGSGAWSRPPQARQQILLDNIYTALAADVRDPVPSEFFRALSAPTVLITGENSPGRYALFYNELQELRTFGPTIVIPKAAHFMHLDNPEAFNGVVLAFIADH
jgi:pimeloyl-ACP methyl ester carboxylesterase